MSLDAYKCKRVRVDQPTTNCLPMIKHLFISSFMCFTLSDLNVMGALPQALELIFEVQRKRSNEKLTRRKIRKISFPSYKTFF